MTAPRLEVRGLTKSFGRLQVAANIDLTLAEGARTALIGPNGAGKTTFVNLVTGLVAPTAGTVKLDGGDITRLRQDLRAGAGLVRTFQVTRLFRDRSVSENVRLAVLCRRLATGAMWRNARADAEVEAEVAGILAAMELAGHAGKTVQTLAYGEQRLIEIALALALRPRVLLLDEPAAGVPKGESGIIMRAIANLPADLAVLFIEHDMDLVFRFAKNIVVLVQGAIFASGTAAEIAADERVREVYFGRSAHGRSTR